MKVCTRCNQAKPLSEFYLNANRGRYEARCKVCFRQLVKSSADADREAVRAANRVAGAKFRETNAARERARTRAAYHAGRERNLANNARWRAEHLDLIAAKEAKRRAARLKAIPTWADLDAIKRIYEAARKQSEQTGVQMHVDHIVPLQGKTVCGLHCEANLQILTAQQNLSKNARSWPDMP